MNKIKDFFKKPKVVLVLFVIFYHWISLLAAHSKTKYLFHYRASRYSF